MTTTKHTVWTYQLFEEILPDLPALEARLNALGASGWEVVALTHSPISLTKLLVTGVLKKQN